MAKIINPSVIYHKQDLLDDEKSLVCQQINAVEAIEGKGLSTSDYTPAEKNKLAGISQNAEANAITSISFNDTIIKPDDNKNVNIVIDTVSDDADGLMSVDDKTKLDGIAEGAEPNVTPDWNAAEGTDGYIDNKPTIPSTAADVGAAPADHTHTAADVGAAPADHTHTATDVGAAAADHTHTAAEVGAAPAEHTHTAADVGAAPAEHTHTASEVGAAPADHTHTAAEVGAAAADHTHTAAEVGAAPADHTHTAAEVGAAAADHTHTAADVGAAPADHTHTATDVGAAPADHTHTATDVGAAPADHTHTQDDVDGLPEIAQKIDTIAEGAQVNVIEKITVNGTEQPITNKTVAITVSAEGSYTEGNGISISNSKEISVDAGNGLDFDGDNKLIVDSTITDAVENAHTLTYENGVEIIDDTDTKTTTIKLEDELYEKISTPLELVEGTNISFDTTDAGKLKISATGGGIASVETDGTTILGDGTIDDKIRLAASPLELEGTTGQITVTPSSTKLSIGLASTITDAISGINTTVDNAIDAKKASEISTTDTGLATADLVANALGDNLQMEEGDGIKLTQASETSPLTISMEIPIVIELDPDAFTPQADGKLHFVVMKKD